MAEADVASTDLEIRMIIKTLAAKGMPKRRIARELSLKARRSIEAENLFLRRELALYRERSVRPRRVDAATRVSLAVLSRLFDWRDAMVAIVSPLAVTADMNNGVSSVRDTPRSGAIAAT